MKFARTVTILLGSVTAYLCCIGYIFTTRTEEKMYSFDVLEKKIDMKAVAKFEKIWPNLQEKLCPNYEPQPKLGARLFMAARREMNVTKWNTRSGNELGFYNGYFDAPKHYLGHDNKTYFEYINIWKCANNQIKLWLEKEFQRVQNIRVARLSSVSPRPCVFTVIRDPISHFLSGYNEVETRNETAPKGLKFAYSLSKKGSPERFVVYVHELLTSTQFGRHWMHWHSYSMSRILAEMKKNGKRLTGYLPSIENVTKTLPPFLNSTCPGALNEKDALAEMEVMGQHESSKDPYKTYAAAKHVWNEKGLTARALCAIHAMDYACWRELPEGIPSLCQQVYSNDMFLDIVYEAKGFQT